MFGAPKNDIDFLKNKSWENILVKSPYYEKGKKREYLPFFPNHPRNNYLKKKKTPYPFQYHLIKLLYFPSLVKAHIKRKKNPLRDGKKFNI
jgi:hypothetical protein